MSSSRHSRRGWAAVVIKESFRLVTIVVRDGRCGKGRPTSAGHDDAPRVTVRSFDLRASCGRTRARFQVARIGGADVTTFVYDFHEGRMVVTDLHGGKEA